ncbi:MAG: hypothetical protein OES24_20375 [Acidimicrobiia bacterium]|nr:hypothetical protein [Acidimicrobiia bacterium]
MSSFDERGDQWGSAAEVDRLLRQEFDRTFAGSEPPIEVLEKLRPSIRRARTMRRVQRVAVGTAAAVALIAGMAGVARLIPTSDIGLTVAGQVDGDAAGDGTQHSDDHRELAVNGTTTPDDGGDGGQDGRNGDDASEGSDAADETQTGVTGVESTTDGVPSPSAPKTTAATPTTRSSSNATTGPRSSPTTDPDSTTSIQPDGSIAVITACGRIIVEFDNGDLALVEVQPDQGFRFDIKESSQRLIEVGLERPGGHCEVKIRPSGDSLDVVVKQEGEHDDE